MSKQTYLTIEQLKAEIIKLGGVKILPKRGSGSGRRGNILRSDLIKVYNHLQSSSKKLKTEIPVSSQPLKDITKLLYTDIWTNVISSLDLDAIKNLCLTNKNLNEKICKNDNYWKWRLNQEFKITEKESKERWLISKGTPFKQLFS